MNIPIIILIACIFYMVFVVYVAIQAASNAISECDVIDDSTDTKINQPAPDFKSTFETHLQRVDENGCTVWGVTINHDAITNQKRR